MLAQPVHAQTEVGCCAAQEYEFDLTVKEGEEASAEEGAAEPMEQD